MHSKAKNFASQLVYACLVTPLLALEVLGHAADILTTWYALTYTSAREVNPILAPILNSRWRYKWVTVSALKGSFLVYEAGWYYRNMDYKWSRYYNVRTAAINATILWAVVVSNLIVIFRRKHGNTST